MSASSPASPAAAAAAAAPLLGAPVALVAAAPLLGASPAPADLPSASSPSLPTTAAMASRSAMVMVCANARRAAHRGDGDVVVVVVRELRGRRVRGVQAGRPESAARPRRDHGRATSTPRHRGAQKNGHGAPAPHPARPAPMRGGGNACKHPRCGPERARVPRGAPQGRGERGAETPVARRSPRRPPPTRIAALQRARRTPRRRAAPAQRHTMLKHATYRERGSEARGCVLHRGARK